VLSVRDRQLGIADNFLPPLGIQVDLFGELLRRAGHRLVKVRRQKPITEIAVRKNALTVPLTAVQQGPNGAFVYVIGPDRKVLGLYSSEDPADRAKLIRDARAWSAKTRR